MAEVKKLLQCSACRDYKDPEFFFAEKRKKTGRQSRCKLCHKAGVKDWRAHQREASNEAEPASRKDQDAQELQTH